MHLGSTGQAEGIGKHLMNNNHAQNLASLFALPEVPWISQAAKHSGASQKKLIEKKGVCDSLPIKVDPHDPNSKDNRISYGK